jgi:transcriptional regulator with XRE-family HTH domain
MPERETEAERSPNPVDIHVGMRVRMRRKMKGVSQEALANQLKLTFQQVQKYERGSNRISASKLYEIARALETPVAWFFEGLADTTGGEGVAEDTTPFMHEIMTTPESGDMLSAFGKIRRRRLRRRLVELAKAIADEDADSEAEA